MARPTLKILQQMPQDFYNVSDHFQTLCMKELKENLAAKNCLRLESALLRLYHLIYIIVPIIIASSPKRDRDATKS